ASGIERRDLSDREITDRCLLSIVNEGAKLLNEGVAQRTSDIDLVWANGYGFPRWRGGPMYWAATRGFGDVVAKIQQFDTKHDFWQPASLLLQAAKTGRSLDELRHADA
ncbi:MAG: 3-hydroxyacyl-CoA dehydrogenase family protein, partial [Pseudomonadota bacterium]